MCWECDNPGADYIGHLVDLIEEHGWAVSGVEATSTDPGWLYTVGLPARYGHPELLIADASTDSARVLNGIADYIRRTARTIAVGETMQLGNRVYTFGLLSETRREAGVIDTSIVVNRFLGVSDVEALEVIRVREYEYCDHHFEEAIRDLTAERR